MKALMLGGCAVMQLIVERHEAHRLGRCSGRASRRAEGSLRQRLGPGVGSRRHQDSPVRIRSFSGTVSHLGCCRVPESLRSSSKRTEDFTGLMLYEYRAYSPTSGRWLSRDPVEENGFEAVRQVGTPLHSEDKGKMPSALARRPELDRARLGYLMSHVSITQSIQGGRSSRFSPMAQGELNIVQQCAFELNSPVINEDRFGLKVRVCIRPINAPILRNTWAMVHCFIKTDQCGNRNYNNKGVGPEPNPAGVGKENTKCVELEYPCLEERKLCNDISASKTEPEWAEAKYNFFFHNCRHWVNTIIAKNNCKKISKYFPGYILPAHI